MEDPTNLELLHYIKDVQGKVADIKEKDLPEINGRVKTTNGSVADIAKWKERVTGAGWAFAICLTVIIVPLLTWAFIVISHIPANINTAVDQALSSRIEKINEAK